MPPMLKKMCCMCVDDQPLISVNVGTQGGAARQHASDNTVTLDVNLGLSQNSPRASAWPPSSSGNDYHSLSVVEQDGVAHGGVSHMEHTWDQPGPLGMKLTHRGSDKSTPTGAIVLDVTKDSIPKVLKGMALEEINGTVVSKKSYN